MARQKITFRTRPYSDYAEIDLDDKCNGFSIKNTGSTLVVCMNETIQPGQSKTFGGHKDEIIEMNLAVAFKVQPIPPVPAINECMITQKIYID